MLCGDRKKGENVGNLEGKICFPIFFLNTDRREKIFSLTITTFKQDLPEKSVLYKILSAVLHKMGLVNRPGKVC